MSLTPQAPSPRSRHFFDREPDGSVRLRMRFDPEMADLIEEAAGEVGLMLWLHRTCRDAALTQVAAHREQHPVPTPVDVDKS